MIDFVVKKFSELKSNEILDIKKIMRRTTGENLVGFPDHIVILTRFNTKIAAFCFISQKSPENHFINENEAVYIYNFIRDPKYIKHRLSYELIKKLKELYLHMNLDVEHDNYRAAAFFEKNGFKKMGDYEHPRKKYWTYSF